MRPLPRCLSVTISAGVFAVAFRSAPALAQEVAQEEHIVERPVEDPRFSIRAAGSAGFGSGVLGTPMAGGSLEWDWWGRTNPVAFGLRVGGLASGWGSEEKHGTYFAGVSMTRFWQVGSGRIIASATLGFAVIRGPYAGTTTGNQPTDSGSGAMLIVRGGYLEPVGPVRLGIALDALLIPGAGSALLVTPMLDIPF